MITDRPVYRPGHTVNFRVVIMGHLLKTGEQLVGGWKPAVDTAFEVTATDVRERVYQQTLTTNEFGSLNGSFRLGAEPPLGMYSFQVRLETDPRSRPSASSRGTSSGWRSKGAGVRGEGDAGRGADRGRRGEGDGGGALLLRLSAVGGKVTYRVLQTPYFPNYRFRVRTIGPLPQLDR